MSFTSPTATAVACANIAFIKYWGNHDQALRLPANGSISMNLDGLITRTTVAFHENLSQDALTLNGMQISGPGLERVSGILDLVRDRAGIRSCGQVISENNFPTGTGIASSASAFAALAMAAAHAAGLTLSEADLSRLARRGSGSAARSIPGGFVEWQMGESEADSYAVSFAPPTHWELVDCVAIISEEHKPTGSTQGHALADTSPLQAARVADAPRRLEICRSAILNRDFEALAEIVEADSNLMHAVMMTSAPALFYWQPATLTVMDSVRAWRRAGLPVFYTIDAGPNVHVICPAAHRQQTEKKLREIAGVRTVLTAQIGGAAQMV